MANLEALKRLQDAGLLDERGNPTYHVKEPVGEKFNYVIGRKWGDKDNSLSCYTYHTTVFFGDIEDAINTRDFIRSRADKYEASEYEIYRIENNFTKVD